MTGRRKRSDTERARLFLLHAGRCHLCGDKIEGKSWDLEHVVEWSLTRDDSDENVRPAHRSCHKAKSSARAADLAKTERQRIKGIGAHQSRRPMPGSRRSGWKAKIGGGWERRT